MHVTRKRKAVFEVRLGLVVLDLPRVDLCIEERQTPCDAVLFFLEQVERDGSGVMRVEQAAALVAELVALGGEGVPLCFVRGAEAQSPQYTEPFR